MRPAQGHRPRPPQPGRPHRRRRRTEHAAATLGWRTPADALDEHLAAAAWTRGASLGAQRATDGGVLYANTERFEAAEHHMLNARQAYMELGLDERAARTLRHLGNVYRNTKRPVLSRPANEEALQLNERLGNWIEVAHCTGNIAAALNMQRDYEGAEGYFLKARDHFRRLGSPGQGANCEDLLRLLYTQLGRRPRPAPRVAPHLRRRASDHAIATEPGRP